MRHYTDSLIIADLQSHSLGGHFKIWLNRTVREALRHFDRLMVYVADEMSAPDLASCDSKDQERICIVSIPKIYGKKRYVGDILGVISRHHDAMNAESQPAPLFLMWAQQYLERDLIFPPLKSALPWKKQLSFERPWGSLTSVSSVIHEETTAPMMEKRIHDLVNSSSQCEAVFLWDEYGVRINSNKYIYLPNVEPVEDDPGWEMPRNEAVTIGSVGQLWGYRSINLMAEIMKSDRNINGYAAGVFKWDSFTSAASTFFAHENLRLTLEEGFVENDLQLNERLRKLDAFVLDSRSYKCPSGLGIRAMAMGRPMITVDSPSWIATLIREEGVGIFWRPGEGNLTERLRDWHASKGSVRSVETARRLSDPQGLAMAYGTMFKRLRKRMDQSENDQ